MKKLISLITIVLAVSIFGISECFSDRGSFAGEYTLFAVEVSGMEMDPGTMGMESALILNEDGTGVLIMNGGETSLTQWTAEDGIVNLTNQNGVDLPCPIADGIIKLEMAENYYLLYADENANPNTGKPASKLSELVETIDQTSGAHLSYDYHMDYMDTTASVDSQAKGEVYYSMESMTVSGYESKKATLFLDETLYVLYPDRMTGTVATTASSSLIKSQILAMDKCYMVIRNNALRRDFTVETREVDGKQFTVEVFPESGYTASAAFYYDETGQLIHILDGAPVAQPSLGETFYTIHCIDEKVDEYLFSLSGYTIE